MSLTDSGLLSVDAATVIKGVDEPLDLTIILNADGSYHYEDEIAKYDGHLCGNKFKFTGGG